MNLQALVVALIVIACAGYAVWALLPAAGQRVMAGALLRLPMPAWLVAPLRRAETQASAGCGGCGSCGSAASPKNAANNAAINAARNAGKPPAVQPITFHPRRR